MDLALKNKVAIVSGSSDGMGRATAEAFAAEGANIAMCARTEKKLNAAAEEIRNRHKVQVFAQPLDVTDTDGVANFVTAVADKFGRIDICVANARRTATKEFSFHLNGRMAQSGGSQLLERGRIRARRGPAHAAQPLGTIRNYHLQLRAPADS